MKLFWVVVNDQLNYTRGVKRGQAIRLRLKIFAQNTVMVNGFCQNTVTVSRSNTPLWLLLTNSEKMWLRFKDFGQNTVMVNRFWSQYGYC